MLADFVRTLEFKPSWFDRDMRIHMQDTYDGYAYICTHVDDFKIFDKNPQIWVDKILSVFLFKEYGPHNYYLSND